MQKSGGFQVRTLRSMGTSISRSLLRSKNFEGKKVSTGSNMNELAVKPGCFVEGFFF